MDRPGSAQAADTSRLLGVSVADYNAAIRDAWAEGREGARSPADSATTLSSGSPARSGQFPTLSASSQHSSQMRSGGSPWTEGSVSSCSLSASISESADLQPTFSDLDESSMRSISLVAPSPVSFGERGLSLRNVSSPSASYASGSSGDTGSVSCHQKDCVDHSGGNIGPLCLSPVASVCFTAEEKVAILGQEDQEAHMSALVVMPSDLACPTMQWKSSVVSQHWRQSTLDGAFDHLKSHYSRQMRAIPGDYNTKYGSTAQVHMEHPFLDPLGDLATVDSGHLLPHVFDDVSKRANEVAGVNMFRLLTLKKSMRGWYEVGAAEKWDRLQLGLAEKLCRHLSLALFLTAWRCRVNLLSTAGEREGQLCRMRRFMQRSHAMLEMVKAQATIDALAQKNAISRSWSKFCRWSKTQNQLKSFALSQASHRVESALAEWSRLSNASRLGRHVWKRKSLKIMKRGLAMWSSSFRESKQCARGDELWKLLAKRSAYARIRRFTLVCVASKQQLFAAYSHSSLSILGRSFDAWAHSHGESKMQQQLDGQGDQVFRATSLSRSMQRLLHFSHNRAAYSVAKLHAVKHHTEAVQAKIFDAWYQTAHDQNVSEALLNQFQQGAALRTMTSVVREWSQWANLKASLRQRCASFSAQLAFKQLAHSITFWHADSSKHALRAAGAATMAFARQSRFVARALQLLGHNSCRRRTVLLQCRAATAHHQTRFLLQVHSQWAAWTKMVIAQRQKVKLLRTRLTGNRLQDVVRAWRDFASWSCQMTQSRSLVVAAVTVRQQEICWAHWRQRYHSIRNETDLDDRADLKWAYVAGTRAVCLWRGKCVSSRSSRQRTSAALSFCFRSHCGVAFNLLLRWSNTKRVLRAQNNHSRAWHAHRSSEAAFRAFVDGVYYLKYLTQVEKRILALCCERRLSQLVTVWRGELALVQQAKANDTKADLKFWFVASRSVFEYWKHVSLLLKIQQDKWKRAVTHSTVSTVQRCFQMVANDSKWMRRDRASCSTADRHYQHSLLQCCLLQMHLQAKALKRDTTSHLLASSHATGRAFCKWVDVTAAKLSMQRAVHYWYKCVTEHGFWHLHVAARCRKDCSIQIEAACFHFQLKLVSSHFEQWCANAAESQCVSAANHTANEHYLIVFLSKVWHLFACRIDYLRQIKLCASRASNLVQTNLLHSTWVMWRIEQQQAAGEASRMAKALRHFDIYSSFCSIQTWLRVAWWRRAQKEVSQAASHHWQNRLRRAILRVFKDEHAIAQQMVITSSKHLHTNMQTIFQHCPAPIAASPGAKAQDTVLLENPADSMFSRFEADVQLSALLTAKPSELSSLVSHWARLRNMFDCKHTVSYWYWAASRRSKLKTAFDRAWATHLRISSGLSFDSWVSFVEMEKCDRKSMLMATAHFKTTHLPTCLSLWQHSASCCAHQKRIMTRAKMHCASRSVGVFWRFWWSVLKTARGSQHLLRRGAQAFMANSVAYALGLWRTTARALTAHKRMVRMAFRSWTQNILVGAMISWQLASEDWRRERLQSLKGVVCYTQSSCRRCWGKWTVVSTARRLRMLRADQGRVWGDHHRQATEFNKLHRLCHTLADRRGRFKVQLHHSKMTASGRLFRRWADRSGSLAEMRAAAFQIRQARQNCLVFSTWTLWQRGLVLQRKDAHERVRGGKLHRGLVLTAVLSVWHSFAGDEKQHRLGTAKAIEHRNGQLLCDGFQTLWTEGCFRKEERRLNSLADTHFAACRSTEAFAGLSWYVAWRKGLQQAAATVEISHIQRATRHHLERWVVAFSNCSLDAKGGRLAQQHYRHTGACRGMREWIKNAAVENRRARQRQAAISHAKTVVLGHSLEAWCLWCSSERRLGQLSAQHEVIWKNRYRRVIMCAWLCVCQALQETRIIFKDTINFWICNANRLAVLQWQEFVLVEKLSEMADSQFNNTAMSRGLVCFSGSLKRGRQLAAAQLRCFKSCCRRVLNLWCQYVQKEVWSSNAEMRADSVFHRRLRQRWFTHWQMGVDVVLNEMVADEFRERSLRSVFLLIWYTFAHDRQLQREGRCLFIKNAWTQAFSKWISFAEDSSWWLSRMNEWDGKRSARLQAGFLEWWQKFAQHNKERQAHALRAKNHDSFHILWKHLRLWHRASKFLRKLSKIQSIVEHRAAGRLVSSVMGHWCWALLQNRQLQSALRTGQRHFSTKAAERALYTWVCYAEARRQYASQMSVAIGAWSPSAISRGFRAWSSWLQEAHIAIRKYTSARQHLTTCMLRRFLNGLKMALMDIQEIQSIGISATLKIASLRRKRLWTLWHSSWRVHVRQRQAVRFFQLRAIQSNWTCWCRMGASIASSDRSAKRAAAFHRTHRVTILLGRWCRESCRGIARGRASHQVLLQRGQSAVASHFSFWIHFAKGTTRNLWQNRASAEHLAHVLSRRSFEGLARYRVKRLLVRQRKQTADRFRYSVLVTQTLASMSMLASAIHQDQASTARCACHAEATARSRAFLSWARSSQLTSSGRAVQALCATRSVNSAWASWLNRFGDLQMDLRAAQAWVKSRFQYWVACTESARDEYECLCDMDAHFYDSRVPVWFEFWKTLTSRNVLQSYAADQIEGRHPWFSLCMYFDALAIGCARSVLLRQFHLQRFFLGWNCVCRLWKASRLLGASVEKRSSNSCFRTWQNSFRYKSSMRKGITHWHQQALYLNVTRWHSITFHRVAQSLSMDTACFAWTQRGRMRAVTQWRKMTLRHRMIALRTSVALAVVASNMKWRGWRTWHDWALRCRRSIDALRRVQTHFCQRMHFSAWRFYLKEMALLQMAAMHHKTVACYDCWTQWAFAVQSGRKVKWGARIHRLTSIKSALARWKVASMMLTVIHAKTTSALLLASLRRCELVFGAWSVWAKDQGHTPDAPSPLPAATFRKQERLQAIRGLQQANPAIAGQVMPTEVVHVLTSYASALPEALCHRLDYTLKSIFSKYSSTVSGMSPQEFAQVFHRMLTLRGLPTSSAVLHKVSGQADHMYSHILTSSMNGSASGLWQLREISFQFSKNVSVLGLTFCGFLHALAAVSIYIFSPAERKTLTQKEQEFNRMIVSHCLPLAPSP